MSDSSVGELFQDSLSSFSDLRTQQVFTFIGNILTTLGTIFLNTIYKLLIIAGTKLISKVALLAVVKLFSQEKMSHIFPDLSLSSFIYLSQTPLVLVTGRSMERSLSMWSEVVGRAGKWGQGAGEELEHVVFFDLL